MVEPCLVGSYFPLSVYLYIIDYVISLVSVLSKAPPRYSLFGAQTAILSPHWHLFQCLCKSRQAGFLILECRPHFSFPEALTLFLLIENEKANLTLVLLYILSGCSC